MDLACLDDLDPLGNEVSEDEALLQDLYHRLIEDPGSNISDPDRGLGALSWLSGVVDPTYGARIEAEFRKDPLVTSVRTRVTSIGVDSFRISVDITTDESELQLVAEVDNATGFRRVS